MKSPAPMSECGQGSALLRWFPGIGAGAASGTTAPAVRPLRRYDRSDGTTAPTVRPLRRYDRSDGTTAPTVRPLRRYDRSDGTTVAAVRFLPAARNIGAEESTLEACDPRNSLAL